MRIVFLTCFVLIASLVSGQDVTGIWRGSFNSVQKVMDMFEYKDRYKLEVQLDQTNKSFQGVTYSYKTTVFYGKATASGTINTATGKVKMMELKLVEVKMQQNSFACIMTYSLQYKKMGDEEFLEGTYTSFNEMDSTSCGKGTVMLRKVPTSDFHKEPFLVKKELERQRKLLTKVPEKKVTAPQAKSTNAKTAVKPTSKPPVTKPPVPKPLVAKQSPPKTTVKPPLAKTVTPLKSPKPLENNSIPNIAKTDSFKNEVPTVKKAMIVPKVLTTRENELVKTITVTSNQVVINIYDNGTIDHDTVSVYLDKKLIVSKQMLTTSPITVKFEMDDVNEVHELVMVAENLGDFPPNTSLMVVRAGGKEYEVRITSTEQKNAVVIFKYEKP